MISAQTLRACRERKPVPTFPDHAPGPVLRQQDRARFFLFTDRVWFTSPRLRGEVGLHRRCNPGEGDSPRVELVEAAPHPDLLPVRTGRRRGRGDAAFSSTVRIWFTSPRLRGEVGLHRRCNPGEGDSPRVGLVERGPSSRPSPRKNGEKEKMSVVAARLPVQAPLNTGLRLSIKACTASR